MSEARGGAGLKPKYVRKKCEHGKNSYICVQCGGKGICEHNKIKRRCKLCGGKGLCEHNIQKYYCKQCGGKGICEHNNVKQQCKLCSGSQLCQHNRIKHGCKLCNGSQICCHNKFKRWCIKCTNKEICEHNKIKDKCNICTPSNLCEHHVRKSICVKCIGSGICEHNKRRNRCVDCCGSQICCHNKLKSRCIPCKGSGRCSHNKIRNFCIQCMGSQICPHKKRKSHCKKCGGSALCKSEWCETSGNAKYEGHCLNCFIHLFPDRPNARNYKTKEKAVVDYILENFPLDKYTWISDKRVKDGCSKRRPDLLLDLGYQVIIVEVDEHQHTDYDCACENKRLMELSQDVYHRPIVLIRFNPDEYMDKSKKITSCWGVNKLGICALKKTKLKEWNTRLEFLKSQIEYWSNSENMSDKTIQIVELFYNQSS